MSLCYNWEQAVKKGKNVYQFHLYWHHKPKENIHWLKPPVYYF